MTGATTTSSKFGLSYLLNYLLVIIDTWINGYTKFPFIERVERKTRFELATFSLARRCSTTEPLPHYNFVPRGRIELPTPAFSVLCSTTELPRRLHYSTKFNLLGIYDLWARQGSNLRPIGYEPTALPLSYGP